MLKQALRFRQLDAGAARSCAALGPCCRSLQSEDMMGGHDGHVRAYRHGRVCSAWYVIVRLWHYTASLAIERLFVHEFERYMRAPHSCEQAIKLR